jgi:23S rRNA (uracil1939-C5)-methyltransferase
MAVVAMGALGDGVTQDGVMIALTLPGERVSARPVAADRAELVEVLIPSAERAVPPCPHFGACGGCALQQWDHAPYLAWKVERVRQALQRVGLDAEVGLAFAAGPGERRRLALHARRDGRTVRLGFKARRSWRLEPIETCVIARRALVEALPALTRLAGPFLASPKSAPTLHVTETDTGLDIDITGVERPGPSADSLAIAGRIAAEADFARVTMAGEMVFQARAPRVRLGAASVALPPGAFLQAVAGAEAAMADILVEAARGARSIADLFCGAGAFAFRLAAVAPVTAADSHARAIEALRSAMATAPGLKAIAATVRDLDRRPLLATDLARPPRPPSWRNRPCRGWRRCPATRRPSRGTPAPWPTAGIGWSASRWWTNSSGRPISSWSPFSAGPRLDQRRPSSLRSRSLHPGRQYGAQGRLVGRRRGRPAGPRATVAGRAAQLRALRRPAAAGLLPPGLAGSLREGRRRRRRGTLPADVRPSGRPGLAGPQYPRPVRRRQGRGGAPASAGRSRGAR